MIIWGRNYHTFPQLVSTTPIRAGGRRVHHPGADRHPRGIGGADDRAGAAGQQDASAAPCAPPPRTTGASLMGVDTNKIIAATFIIGSGWPRWPG